MSAQVISDSEAGLLIKVDGAFCGAIAPRYRLHAIAGLRLAGRYSSIDQPTLYLSASREGMAAAIAVHKERRLVKQEVI